jgi:DNA-directed RNA polymerase subunit RPC12/RpoP
VGNVFDALKAGARAAADAVGPGEYAAAGRQVRCAHCGGTRFALRSVPVTVDALQPYGYALRCTVCSHLALFAEAPERR